jgi:myo-inositol-1(or 4)-monophosphatase
MSDDLATRRRVAEEAAKAAGAVQLRHRGEALQLEIKHGNPIDYATRVDYDSQAAARDVILRAFPGETVIGEESGLDWPRVDAAIAAGCWLIDPLDGTMEYVRGSPAFSCIVSYVRAGEPFAAAVYFAAWGEMYSAGAGLGATFNGQPVKVSGETDLARSVFATAYRGTDPARVRGFADGLVRLLPHIEAFRIPGAPAVGACQVAAGSFDIFCSSGIFEVFAPGWTPAVLAERMRSRRGQPWETAAFILLVREAGGAAAAADGGAANVTGVTVVAASQTLLDRFLALFAQ